MALTPQDIDRIAHLARLELRPQESERMLTQINDFFAMVEKMRAVDTTGVEPLAHPVAAVQEIALRLREDAVGEDELDVARSGAAISVCVQFDP